MGSSRVNPYRHRFPDWRLYRFCGGIGAKQFFERGHGFMLPRPRSRRKALFFILR